MTKYRVALVVEASSIAMAAHKFLWDGDGDQVEGIAEIEVTEWE